MDDADRDEQGSGAVRRLRWRLRGAWLWPAFVVATLAEMALLHWLPVQGESTRWISAMLVAGCLNLIAVVVLGGPGALVLRRRRPDMPKVVASDYAGRGRSSSSRWGSSRPGSRTARASSIAVRLTASSCSP